MSAAVASMTSPHQLPLRSSTNEVARSSPTKGYAPPSTPAERVFAEGQKSSPSKAQSRDESRGAYRAQSIRAILEVNGDVEAFEEETRNKRRQLDEQIHRYIKQKDREYKFFERDARIKYRNAGANALKADQSQASSSRKTILTTTNGIKKPSPEEAYEANAKEAAARSAAPLQARSQPRVADNGLRDPQVAREREADLLGLFTPSFLPLLNKGIDPNQRSNSAPPADVTPSSAPAAASAISHLETPSDHALLRSNSDPVDEKHMPRLTRAKLEKRTSSSGSESKNLVSALKSPAANSRVPKRKRVSLVVGDEVVAPSDNVAAAGSTDHDRESHQYGEVERIDFVSSDTTPRDAEEDEAAEGAPNVDPNVQDQNERPPDSEQDTESTQSTTTPKLTFSSPFPPRRPSGIASALAAHRGTPVSTGLMSPSPTGGAPSPRGTDPDLFNFSDNELTAEESQDRLASDVEDVSDVSPVQTPAPPEEIRVPREERSAESLVRPTPKLRTSSSSSSQPVSPGFSKPSVQKDPMVAFDEDVITPEIEQNEEFGSVKNMPSLLDKTGSLGESFMERNAEELRKTGRRRASAASG